MIISRNVTSRSWVSCRRLHRGGLDRPELDKPRDLITNDTVQAVVVYGLDRLARKAAYQMLLEEEFKKDGARVYYVWGDYADTDEGRLLKQVRASIAEYERAKIRSGPGGD